MSTIHPSRRRFSGIIAVLALTLLAPMAVTAEDEVADLAPVAGPAVDDTSAHAVRAATRVLAAQDALQSGDIGSMQEERFLAIVAAAPSWDATSGYGSVEASRAAASTLVVPIAAPSWDTTSGYGAVEASRATIGHPATSTIGEAELLAQFRAVELSLSRHLGAEQQVSSCSIGS
jgi:hypothetical protein